MLVYEWKPILVIDYEKHEDSIMKRLLKIMEKISQLRKVTRQII